MNTLFVGLDIGSRTFHQLGLQPDGSITINRRQPMSEANLITAFNDLGKHVQVHLEAGELAPWVRSVIAPLVQKVVISHPQANAWIARDPNKCDQRDAFKLADLLRMNRVHEVYYAEQQSRRDFKLLVQHYDDLCTQQKRLKLKIKARLRTQGIIVRDRRVYLDAGREKILAQVSSLAIRTAISQLFTVLEQTITTQKAAEKLMLQAAKAFPEIALFQAVPGLGPITACRFSAYVQTPHRFSNVRKLWRYCRLGGSQKSSDGNPLGRRKLDRCGNGRLKDVSRKAFEAARRAKADNAFKRAYERTLKNTHNETQARLTVQRKIVSVLRAIWLTQTPYRDELGEPRIRPDQ
jgi:transposase